MHSQSQEGVHLDYTNFHSSGDHALKKCGSKQRQNRKHKETRKKRWGSGEMGILCSVYIYLSIGLSPSTAHTRAIKSTARHHPLNQIFNNK